MRARGWLAAAVVALAGAIETAWLTIRWLGEGHVPCVASARIDCAALFLASGTMPLGLPLTLWGNAGYTSATLLAAAAVWLEGAWAGRARAAFHAVALGMALFSLFLVARMVTLGALCPWCLLSAALSLALGAFAAADMVRGHGLDLRPVAAGAALAVGMVALTLVTGGHRPVRPAGAPRELSAIARHLNASGAHFYGVWWCEGCREQKELFGVAALELPYVECSRGCPDSIDVYPTWVIGGRRIPGMLSPDSLARLSGFERSP
jgi:uncharacterized membrane protein